MTDVYTRSPITELCTYGRGKRPRQDLTEAMMGFQLEVHDWSSDTFTKDHIENPTERGDRFLEEVLELLQAADYDLDRVAKLVDYVRNRPKGEIHQEVAGTVVTLSVLCNTLGVNIGATAERELQRCWDNQDKIRAKQDSKPRWDDSPLPGVTVQDLGQDRLYKHLKRGGTYRVLSTHVIGYDSLRDIELGILHISKEEPWYLTKYDSSTYNIPYSKETTSTHLAHVQGEVHVGTLLVAYQSVDPNKPQIWVRPRTEFFDGRFEKVHIYKGCKTGE
jgi:hypothetical protein